MAVPLVKLSVVIGAGLVGSAVTKEGGLSDVTKKISGALKAVTKHLHHDNDNSRSSRKPQIDFDSLSAQGWKLSDVMFVTRRGLSDACTSVGKQLELVSSSLAAAKRHLSSRVDAVDRNLEECKELTVATKHEVSKLHGDLSGFHMEIECVHRAIQNLETKLGKLEGNQELTA